MIEQLNAVLYEALPAVLAVLLPVITIWLRGLLKKHTGKLDAETQVQIDSVISGVINQSVDYVEQWAKTKQKAGTVAPDGQEKLRAATTFILQELDERGITGLATDALQRKVEATLGSRIKEGG